MKGFKNAKVYVEGKGIIKTDVAIKDGKIFEIGKNLDLSEVIIIPEDSVVLPGFIDEHIHGTNNADAMDGSLSSLETIATNLAKEGTTSFLATTMTQSKENIKKALNAVNDYISSNNKAGSRLLGVHLEGPFISENHIGAQPLEYVADPDNELFDEFFKASGENIKVITLAPEENGALDFIKHIKEKKVVVSAGHTDAGVLAISNAMDCGLSCVTHTYNAQRGVHHREVGTVGSAFLFDQLYTEVICDLIHVSLPAIKLLLKNKPKDKVVLITDAMRAKNLPDGESELGGQTVYVKDGSARLANGALAGSLLKLNDAVKNMCLSAGVPFIDAVDFATINPAKNLGLDDKIGSIKVGKNADFCVLDGEFNCLLTIRDGEIIYKK